MPHRSVLVVTPVVRHRVFAASTLQSAGFGVDTADTFEEGQRRVAAAEPIALLADIRLGDYNGLHLVLDGKARYPRLAALVIYDLNDRVLQKEADRLGATFVVRPVSAADLLAAVLRTLSRAPGDPTPIHPPFERRTADRRRTMLPGFAAERRSGERRRDITTIVDQIGTLA